MKIGSNKPIVSHIGKHAVICPLSLLAELRDERWERDMSELSALGLAVAIASVRHEDNKQRPDTLADLLELERCLDKAEAKFAKNWEGDTGEDSDDANSLLDEAEQIKDDAAHISATDNKA